MTQYEIISMAREAGFTGCLLPEEADNLIGGVFIGDENLAKPIELFAALVAAHEREACAKLMEDMAAQDRVTNYYKVAANAIRERGEK